MDLVRSYKSGILNLFDFGIPLPDFIRRKLIRIYKIIQNGPATIIIDRDGKKTVVKNEDPSDNRYPTIGFNMCLLRYLLDSRRYHELVCYAMPWNWNGSNIMVDVCSSACCISLIGSDLYLKLMNSIEVKGNI